MEKPNPSRNTGLRRLPIGFRFRPTDEELVVHYLKRKVCALPLPASVIPELDVFRTSPWDLPGDPREKRYFFRNKKEEENDMYRYSNSTSVRDGSGYWKTTGRHRQIISSVGSNQALGIKRSLAFYQGKRPHGLRTDWVMVEYSLVASGTAPYTNLQSVLQVGDWIVCRLHRKQSKDKNRSCRTDETRGRGLIRPGFWDFAKEDLTDHLGPPQPSSSSSSSCSSAITHVSCNEFDQEANSDYN